MNKSHAHPQLVEVAQRKGPKSEARLNQYERKSLWQQFRVMHEMKIGAAAAANGLGWNETARILFEEYERGMDEAYRVGFDRGRRSVTPPNNPAPARRAA